jgi:hypothetical protein
MQPVSLMAAQEMLHMTDEERGDDICYFLQMAE